MIPTNPMNPQRPMRPALPSQASPTAVAQARPPVQTVSSTPAPSGTTASLPAQAQNGQGHGWGHAFQQQYGKPPGQMREQWQAYRTANGFGPGMSPQAPTPSPTAMTPPAAPRPAPAMGPQNPAFAQQFRTAMDQWRQNRPSYQDMLAKALMGS